MKMLPLHLVVIVLGSGAIFCPVFTEQRTAGNEATARMCADWFVEPFPSSKYTYAICLDSWCIGDEKEKQRDT